MGTPQMTPRTLKKQRAIRGGVVGGIQIEALGISRSVPFN